LLHPEHPLTLVAQTSIAPRLPDVCATLFNAKKAKKISFEELAKAVGREEVAVAAIFYGQAKASEEDAEKLAELLGLPVEQLKEDLYAWPDRGRGMCCEILRSCCERKSRWYTEMTELRRAAKKARSGTWRPSQQNE
jgi:transcriptional regulator with XRE-family HTH domain